MRNDLSTISFFLLFAFILVFCSNSCTQTLSADYFNYTDSPFEAKLSGSLDSSETEVWLAFDPYAQGNESRITVVFSKPDSLAGLNITYSGDGKTSARLGDIIADSAGFDELISPFLYICTRYEPSSVKRNADGSTSVTVKDEELSLEYTFKKDSDIPCFIKGRMGDREIDITLTSESSEKLS